MLLTREPSTGTDYHKWVFARIKAVRTWRQSEMCWNGETDWVRFYRRYIDQHFKQPDQRHPYSDDPQELISVNLTASDVLAYVAFLANQPPKWNAKPTREDLTVSAENMTGLLNYEWPRRHAQRQIKRATFDLVIIGHCILETGVDIEEMRDVPKSAKDGKLSYEDYIKDESVYVRRGNPFRHYFDPEAPEKDYHTARWAFKEVIKPLGDVLASSRYDSKVIRSIKAGIYKPTPLSSFYLNLANDGNERNSDYRSDNSKDQYNEKTRVVLFEWYDRKFDKYCVYAAGVEEEPLYEGPNPYPWLDGFPFIKADFIHVPNQCYGLGIPKLIESHQDQLNRMRTMQFDVLRRNVPKYLISEDMDEVEANKLSNGGPCSWARTENPSEDVKPMQIANIPQDNYQLEGVIRSDIHELDGLNELTRGGQLKSRTSAREAQAIVDFQSLKTNARADELDEAILDVGRHWIRHMQEMYRTPHVVQIVGPSGEYWRNLAIKDIQGEFDLELESTSADRHDPDWMQQQAQQMFANFVPNIQQINQYLQAENPPKAFVMSEFLKWYFKQFDIKGSGRFFPPMLIISQPEVTATEMSGQSTTPPQLSAPQMAQPPQTPGAAMGAGQPQMGDPRTNQLQAQSANPNSELTSLYALLAGKGTVRPAFRQ